MLNDPLLRTTFSALCSVPAHTPTLTVQSGVAYVQTHYIERSLGELSQAGPVALITHGSDATATDNLAAKLPGNVTQWFSMNCGTQRAKPLPIGLRSDSHDCPLLATIRRAAQTPAGGGRLAYLCATWNTPNLPDYVRAERYKLYRRFSGESWVTIKGGGGINDVPFDEYAVDIRAHKYVLCPRGAGVDTHRAWEALYLGAIPIMLHSEVMDRFTTIPALRVHDWSQVTRELLERKYQRLTAEVAACVEPLAANYWLKDIRDAMPVR